jgi:hypothetical protein
MVVDLSEQEEKLPELLFHRAELPLLVDRVRILQPLQHLQQLKRHLLKCLVLQS